MGSHFICPALWRVTTLTDNLLTENLLKRLDTFAKRQNASVVIVGQADPEYDWSVMITWGQEAPDSPMAGAQALGSADFLNEAIAQALTEAGA